MEKKNIFSLNIYGRLNISSNLRVNVDNLMKLLSSHRRKELPGPFTILCDNRHCPSVSKHK